MTLTPDMAPNFNPPAYITPTIADYHIPAMIQAAAYLRGQDMSEDAAVRSVVRMYTGLFVTLSKALHDIEA